MKIVMYSWNVMRGLVLLTAISFLCDAADAGNRKQIGDADPTGQVELYYRVDDSGQIVITAYNHTGNTIKIRYSVDAECWSLDKWKDYSWDEASIDVNGNSDNSDFLNCHALRDSQVRNIDVRLVRWTKW